MRPCTLLIVGSLCGLGTALPCVAADPAGVPADAAPPPAATQPSAPPPTPTAAKPATSEASEAEIKRWRAKGYKPVVRDGKTFYCRSEQQLGSRFEHQVCSTPEQLAAATRASQDLSQDAQRAGLGYKAPGK
jgi:hypothetical protein